MRGPISTDVTAGCARTNAVANCGNGSPASSASAVSFATAAVFA